MRGLEGRRRMEKVEKPKVERPGTEDKKKRKEKVFHTAEEKCRAVLSVWTERRTIEEVCREVGVVRNLFDHWQQKAMEGMLLALKPRFPLDKGMALSPRLAVLLETKSKTEGAKSLERRLAKLQGRIPESKSGGPRETGAEKKL
jgi:transposase-like protein